MDASTVSSMLASPLPPGGYVVIASSACFIRLLGIFLDGK